MWRFIVALMVVISVAVFGFSLADRGTGEVEGSAMMVIQESDIEGYTRAFEPREWSFPRDHGAHNAYQLEWWYYTGNLQAEDGRHFGFQFTIFRRALNPGLVSDNSEWRTNQAYMAHFSLSDIADGRFYHDERYSRGAAGLAGALPDETQPDAPYRVWLEGWEASALNDDATLTQIVADAGDFAINFTLEQDKAYVLQGEDGLSAKSDEPGNASQYYSLTRLLTDGTITIEGETYTVSGTTWMDREFSTSALGEDAQGWDWFAMHFDDGRELVVGQIRLNDGTTRTSYTGTMVYEDGTSAHLDFDQYSIDVTDTWESPHTGAVYPAGWVVTVDAELARTDADMEIIVTPLMSDQELNTGDIAYWEGAVQLSGDVNGFGYAELTGYIDAIAGRF